MQQTKRPTSQQRKDMERLIREQARAAGVPEEIALAFADIESGLNPTREGDLNWHERQGGALYREHVLDNPRLTHNPARLEPSVWHSYGLFQLLAPYAVRGNEHPRALLDPLTNTQRGVAKIAALLAKHDNDPVRARLSYVGYPSTAVGPGPDAVRERVAEKLRTWGYA